MRSIHRVAVLGAGTMGSRIAAHFANAGIPALLLDLKSKQPGDPNLVARQGIETAAKQKPTAFFVPSNAGLIETGNFDDDLSKIKSCQWIIEAVTENLEIKRDIWEELTGSVLQTRFFRPTPAAFPCERFGRLFTEFQRQFLGTHFFNPPRYLHLTGSDPGREDKPGNSEVCFRIRRVSSAKASSLARTRRISSPTASAAFSAPPLSSSRSKDDYTSRRSGRAHRAAHRSSQERQLSLV